MPDPRLLAGVARSEEAEFLRQRELYNEPLVVDVNEFPPLFGGGGLRKGAVLTLLCRGALSIPMNPRAE